MILVYSDRLGTYSPAPPPEPRRAVPLGTTRGLVVEMVAGRWVVRRWKHDGDGRPVATAESEQQAERIARARLGMEDEPVRVRIAE